MKTNAVDTLIQMIGVARRGRNRRRAAAPEAKPAAPLRAMNAILPAAAVAAMLQACTPAQVQPTSDPRDAYPVAQAEANPVMQEPPEASAPASNEAPLPEPVLVASTEPVPVLAANPVPTGEAASANDGKEAATKPAPAEKAAAVVAGKQAEAKPTKPAAPEREAAPRLKVDADFASYRGLVGFASGSETLGPIGRAEVEAMIPPAMKAEAIALRGRTGAVKASEEMRKLAVGRGVAVRRVFVEHGVDKGKIQIFVKEGGFGDYLHPEDPRSPENRRVEIEMKMPDGVVLKPSK